MKLQGISTLTLAGVLFLGGCATKKYVAKTVDPVRDQVNTVAATTAKQGEELNGQKAELGAQGDQIRKQGADIEKAKTDIDANRERATAADARAGDALKKTDLLGKDLASLRQVVADLDDYKPAGNAAVPFAFNRDSLTAESKADLDKLVSGAGELKRYFIAVEGFTDQIGPAAYNNQLSRRRAEAVVRYLVASHDIPVYRIHMIGLGPEKPADPGRDSIARAKNRRVEVTIFTAENPTTAKADTASPR